MRATRKGGTTMTIIAAIIILAGLLEIATSSEKISREIADALKQISWKLDKKP